MANDRSTEMWLRMYEEQIRHARHHETLRTQSTNLVVVISGALLAFATANSSASRLLIGAFLFVVNVYGLLMSIKHYERSRLHVEVASEYRGVVSDESTLNGLTINEARERSHKRHKARFAHFSRIRAYILWGGLHIILGLIGLLIAFTDPAPNKSIQQTEHSAPNTAQR